MVSAELAEVNRDENGIPIGLAYKFKPSGGAALSGSAFAEVVSRKGTGEE